MKFLRRYLDESPTLQSFAKVVRELDQRREGLTAPRSRQR